MCLVGSDNYLRQEGIPKFKGFKQHKSPELVSPSDLFFIKPENCSYSKHAPPQQWWTEKSSVLLKHQTASYVFLEPILWYILCFSKPCCSVFDYFQCFSQTPKTPDLDNFWCKTWKHTFINTKTLFECFHQTPVQKHKRVFIYPSINTIRCFISV